MGRMLVNTLLVWGFAVVLTALSYLGSKRILRLVTVSAQNVYRPGTRSILARPRLPPLLLRSWSGLFCRLMGSSVAPGYLICYGNEGNMPNEDVMRSIALIGKEVIPALHKVNLRPYE